MEIDLTKSETAVEQVDTDAVKVSSNGLRKHIRVLISSFMSKPRPVRPTDANIMNEYLSKEVPEFATINRRIIELNEELKAAPKKSHRRLGGQIEALHARRMEIISDAASDTGFLAFRSERKAAFNQALSRFEEEASIIQELKPYLGMPHLPDIEATSLAADVILSILSGMTQKAPMKGQMVLMLDESVHSKPQFLPRAAFREGISPSLRADRGGGAVRVPYSPTERLGVEALTHGAFERKGRVYFKLENGRPQAHSAWNEIDRYLPFSCRSLSLPMIPVVVPLASGFDFEEVFGEDSWALIEDEILDRHAKTCTVCGGIDNVKAVPRWRFREPVKGAFGPGVQQLEGFITMCGSCSDTLRPKLSSLLGKTDSGFVLDVSREREAWLRVLNRWNEPRHKEFAKEAYLLAIEAHRRRSKTNWIIDLSSQRSAFFMLQDGFYVERNGWIWPMAGSPFKVVGAPFYENEDQTRNFYQKPSIYDVPWDSTVAQVSRILEDFDLAVADEGGKGFDGGFPTNPVPDYSPAMVKSLEKVTNSKIETIEVDTSERPTDSSSADSSSSDKKEDDENDVPFDTSPAAPVSDDDYDEDDDYQASAPDYHERFASGN
tara:strand:+ start:8563 stop:10377 length:1815 start_codon:yes stop_codon:yes gene_type:complete